MKEFTLGKSRLNVSSVASVSADQETLEDMKEFTLGKRLMNVNKWFCQSGHFKSHPKLTAEKCHVNAIVSLS